MAKRPMKARTWRGEVFGFKSDPYKSVIAAGSCDFPKWARPIRKAALVRITEILPTKKRAKKGAKR